MRCVHLSSFLPSANYYQHTNNVILVGRTRIIGPVPLHPQHLLLPAQIHSSTPPPGLSAPPLKPSPPRAADTRNTLLERAKNATSPVSTFTSSLIRHEATELVLERWAEVSPAHFEWI